MILVEFVLFPKLTFSARDGRRRGDGYVWKNVYGGVLEMLRVIAAVGNYAHLGLHRWGLIWSYERAHLGALRIHQEKYYRNG